MYKYFVPDEPEKIMAQAPTVNAVRDIVPLYNEHGEFFLFIGV
jgi:hypothetical protein